MRLTKLAAILLLLFSLVSCGGGSSASAVSAIVDTDSTEAPDVTYSGNSVSIATDEDGKTVIASTVSGKTYEITLTDASGNPVSALDVVFYEDGDDAFIYISDPDGTYSEVVIIGTPDEIDADRGRADGDVGLGLEMAERAASTFGFTEDSFNLPYVYVSKEGKNTGNWETNCFTMEEMSSYFYDKYSADLDDVYSVLSFYGSGADAATRYLKFRSEYMGNSGERSSRGAAPEDDGLDPMNSALSGRMEHVFGAQSGYFDREVFRLTCYYPESGAPFFAICEASRNTATCASENRHALNGTPAPTVVVDNYYAFAPSASDPDHSTLTYSVTNKPAWATLDATTGKLYGTPSSTGVNSNITITGTDGDYSVNIGPFSINVINATLAKTGQTAEITAGDDGTYTAGIAMNLINSANFTTDTNTGLVWEDTATVVTRVENWATAVSTCDALDDGTYSDYRLPTIQEMETIMQYASLPTIDGTFANSDSSDYWTATEKAGNSANAWFMTYGSGISGQIAKTNTKKFRCVRGNALPAADFTRDDASDVVVDNNTGLMWLDGGLTSSIGFYWEDAIAACTSERTGGFTDWRLPNIRELKSISDYSVQTALNTAFQSNAQNIYYSSTTVPDSGETLAYTFNFNGGWIDRVTKTLNEKYVRCVRGGL